MTATGSLAGWQVSALIAGKPPFRSAPMCGCPDPKSVVHLRQVERLVLPKSHHAASGIAHRPLSWPKLGGDQTVCFWSHTLISGHVFQGREITPCMTSKSVCINKADSNTAPLTARIHVAVGMDDVAQRVCPINYWLNHSSLNQATNCKKVGL